METGVLRDRLNFVALMSPQIFHNYLKQYFPNLQFSDRQIGELYHIVRFRNLQKGERLYLPGDRQQLYLVLHGRLKKVYYGGEVDVITDILYPSRLFGTLSLLDHRPGEEYAEALSFNTIIACCTVEAIRAYLDYHPSFALQLAINNGLLLKKMERRLLPLFRSDARGRLLQFLRSWAQADGEWKDDSVRLERYLTYSDMASYIAVSRQTLHTLFKQLHDEGGLFISKHFIEVSRDLLGAGLSLKTR